MQKTIRLPWRPASASEPNGWQSNAPCKFFAQGRCRNGEHCSFSHAIPAPTPALINTEAEEQPLESPKPVAAKVDARSHIPCRFFASSGCLKGASCPFAHPDGNSPENKKGDSDLGEADDEAAVDPNQEPDDKADNWVRAIGGAVVQFASGVVVIKAPLLSDFSAVRISNLPHDSTQATVAGILEDHGFQTSLDNIRVQSACFSTTPSQCAADVRFEEPQLARKFSESIDPQSSFKVDVVNPSLPRESSFQRIECKKV